MQWALGSGVADACGREDADDICEAPASHTVLYDPTNMYRPAIRLYVSRKMGKEAKPKSGPLSDGERSVISQA